MTSKLTAILIYIFLFSWELDMAKVLLHIGLHKTATTTLQKNVFCELSRNNEINYLSISKECFASFNITPLVAKGKINSLNLDNSKLNVISDERITLPDTFLKTIVSYKDIDEILDYKTILKKYRAILLNHEVTILLSIRNQKDYLSSLSYTFSKLLKKYYLKENYSNFIYDSNNSLHKDIEDSINFYDIWKYLVNSYGDSNVKVLLYEDLIENPKNYFNLLGNILQIEPIRIEKMFEHKLNESYKKSGIIKVTQPNVVFKVLSFFYRVILKKPLEFFLKERLMVFKKTIKNNKLFYKQHNVKGLESLDAINKDFYSSNKLLFESLGLNISTGLKYDYFREV